MFEMSFLDDSFDIIWAEGSIYLIGFERGLKEWRQFIKPNGFLVVHDKMGPGSDALYAARRPAEENHWTPTVSAAGMAPRTGTSIDVQPLVDGGWGILFISDSGESKSVYFARAPLIFA